MSTESAGVPVLMGGFHATLMPEEVKRFADVIITGEAESVWETTIDDLRHGTPQREYHGNTDRSAHPC